MIICLETWQAVIAVIVIALAAATIIVAVESAATAERLDRQRCENRRLKLRVEKLEATVADKNALVSVLMANKYCEEGESDEDNILL